MCLTASPCCPRTPFSAHIAANSGRSRQSSATKGSTSVSLSARAIRSSTSAEGAFPLLQPRVPGRAARSPAASLPRGADPAFGRAPWKSRRRRRRRRGEHRGEEADRRGVRLDRGLGRAEEDEGPRARQGALRLRNRRLRPREASRALGEPERGRETIGYSDRHADTAAKTAGRGNETAPQSPVSSPRRRPGRRAEGPKGALVCVTPYAGLRRTIS